MLIACLIVVLLAAVVTVIVAVHEPARPLERDEHEGGLTL